ncbi:DUF2505 domain-containing protein [Saccharopolyspora rhizosphaerae]|uniref:DUF2505 domain-containing protein n=1 Tax=Saccharopolyspora rhizosphaerae TaxID=2492662 RepID=A0A426JJ02_9PSEU|nr:DUF2505 domain-containing protein [Saccharopolyspora rhizosphaerae]RRO13093.1 DUF2505 domain-containing protein [Saccharopolyspora rhizosphaerae]
MARRIEHRSTSERPAVEVYRALIDSEYLTARLEELGGSTATLLQHVPTDAGARFQTRQGVPVDKLPSLARTVVGGDLLIDRSESWRREEEGHYTGEIAAEIAGAPCSITGSMWLRDLVDPTGPAVSELVVEGTVKVNVPFVGSKAEDLVAEQVQKMLVEEDHFTAAWLAKHA